MRTVLFSCLAIIFFLPMINQIFRLVKEEPLKGAVVLAENPELKLDTWWDGTYQEQKTAFINDNVGFRPFMVRVNNQTDIELFDRTHAGGAMIGKNGFLYESGYISSYVGSQKMDSNLAMQSIRKLQKIRDTLAKHHVKLILAIAPSKARYYPEYFPEMIKDIKRKPSDYTTVKHLIDSLGILNIDFSGWFANMKPTAKHPLFTKAGTHWSYYAADIALDSFNHFMSARLGAEIPEISWDEHETQCSSTAQGTDDDILQGLNLLYPITRETYCYNKLRFSSSPTTVKPRVIFISDSFFWTVISRGVADNCYDWEYWNYFKEVWDSSINKGLGKAKPIDKTPWMEHLQEADAVVLLFSEPNLNEMCTGFITEAYKRFYRE